MNFRLTFLPRRSLQVISIILMKKIFNFIGNNTQNTFENVCDRLDLVFAGMKNKNNF